MYLKALSFFKNALYNFKKKRLYVVKVIKYLNLKLLKDTSTFFKAFYSNRSQAFDTGILSSADEKY